jgi:hypothetical protein
MQEIRKRAFRDEGERVQSEVLDWIRFPLIVMVVFIHCAGSPPLRDTDFLNMQMSHLSQTDVFLLLRLEFSYILSEIAVPAFFVMSGYFFFYYTDEWNKHSYVEKLKKRWKTLGIPYLFWNFLKFFSVVLFIGWQEKGHIVQFLQETNWWGLFWNCSINPAQSQSYPCDVPLWYIRDLMVCCVLSFVIYQWIKRTRGYGVILLGLCYVFDLWPDLYGLGTCALFFFSVGAYFAINKKNMLETLRHGRKPVYIVFVVLMLVSLKYALPVTGKYIMVYRAYVVFGVWAIFNLAYSLYQKVRMRKHPLLIESVFFIFAAHTIGLITVCNRLIAKVLVDDSPVFILCVRYLITPFLVVGVCLLLYALMKKLLPRFLSVITGGR